jgi:tRNA threonylcarbamoyladenosine biosynthesis protein TsaB
MILAIDTATQYAALALYNQDGIFAEETWRADRNHTVELMPRIVRMLELAELKVAGLAALAVSLGPGSFTGLRIGLAAAKGLALPNKLPLIGVSTLEMTAYPWRDSPLPVWAIVQAGRGRILAACYAKIDGHWQTRREPELTHFKALAANIDEPALCTGEIDRESAQILAHGSKNQAKIVSPAARLRRAAYLAEIAAARLKANQVDDPDTLSPIYLSPL